MGYLNWKNMTRADVLQFLKNTIELHVLFISFGLKK